MFGPGKTVVVTQSRPLTPFSQDNAYISLVGMGTGGNKNRPGKVRAFITTRKCR